MHCWYLYYSRLQNLMYSASLCRVKPMTWCLLAILWELALALSWQLCTVLSIQTCVALRIHHQAGFSSKRCKNGLMYSVNLHNALYLSCNQARQYMKMPDNYGHSFRASELSPFCKFQCLCNSKQQTYSIDDLSTLYFSECVQYHDTS